MFIFMYYESCYINFPSTAIISGTNQIFLTLQVLASQAFQVIDADGDGWATLRSLAGSECVQLWVEN